MSEWSKVSVLKTDVRKLTVGSNPTLSVIFKYMTYYSQYLREIRFRILFVLLAFVSSWAIAYLYTFEFLWFFLYPFVQLQAHTFFITGISEGLEASFKMASHLAIFSSFPFGLYQILCFYSPGLFKYERLKILFYLYFFLFLSFAGFLFCWAWFTPFIWNFFLAYIPNSSIFTDLSVLNQTGLLRSQEFFWMCFWGILVVCFIIWGCFYAISENIPLHLNKNRKLIYFVLILGTAGICPPDIGLQLFCNIGVVLFFEAVVFLQYWVQWLTEFKNSP